MGLVCKYTRCDRLPALLDQLSGICIAVVPKEPVQSLFSEQLQVARLRQRTPVRRWFDQMQVIGVTVSVTHAVSNKGRPHTRMQQSVMGRKQPLLQHHTPPTSPLSLALVVQPECKTANPQSPNTELHRAICLCSAHACVKSFHNQTSLPLPK